MTVLFSAVREAGYGPKRRFAAMQQRVCNAG